jgi:hypothetical protein
MIRIPEILLLRERLNLYAGIRTRESERKKESAQKDVRVKPIANYRFYGRKVQTGITSDLGYP